MIHSTIFSLNLLQRVLFLFALLIIPKPYRSLYHFAIVSSGSFSCCLFPCVLHVGTCACMCMFRREFIFLANSSVAILRELDSRFHSFGEKLQFFL